MLHRNTKRRSLFSFNFIAITALLFLLNACTKADIGYGSQLVGDQYSQLVMTDTFSVDLSTIYLDSFATSASGSGLVGSYKDNKFGQINAWSYYQLQPPSSFSDVNVLYDSLELILTRKNSFYGDSTQPLQFSVYQLSNVINKINGTGYYSYDTVPHETNALGSKSVNIYPGITDTVSIRLSDVLGKQLLSLLVNKADETSSATNFINYFKGLCVIPNQTNAYMAGFKDSIVMRLHYKDLSTSITDDKYVNFTLDDNTRQFNHISADRTGTPIEALNSKNKTISSVITGNASFFQPSTNVTTKISIPSIRDILTIPNYLKLERAVLTVKPLIGTYEGLFTLPDSLRLTTADKNNTLGSDITYSTGVVQYGSFTRDYLYEANTQYTYDLTSYLNSQIAISVNNENGLILRQANSVENVASFKRAVLADRFTKDNQIKLQLYYLTVK